MGVTYHKKRIGFVDPSEDHFTEYLNEIRQYKLLTPDEEIRYARMLRDCPAERETARTKLTQSNLRLVVSIAKRYFGVHSANLSPMDMINEGNMGLMRAIEKYNPETGFRFTTYASWWIRQAIVRSIPDNKRGARIPVHMNESYAKLQKTTRLLVARLGREPSLDELSTESGLSKKKIQTVYTSCREMLSFETEIGDDATLSDYLGVEDPHLVEADQDDPYATKIELTNEAMSYLTVGERTILRYRAGIITGKSLSLEEIGARMDVSRERVRQIESKALAKVKRYVGIDELAAETRSEIELSRLVNIAGIPRVQLYQFAERRGILKKEDGKIIVALNPDIRNYILFHDDPDLILESRPDIASLIGRRMGIKELERISGKSYNTIRSKAKKEKLLHGIEDTITGVKVRDKRWRDDYVTVDERFAQYLARGRHKSSRMNVIETEIVDEPKESLEKCVGL